MVGLKTKKAGDSNWHPNRKLYSRSVSHQLKSGSSNLPAPRAFQKECWYSAHINISKRRGDSRLGDTTFPKYGAYLSEVLTVFFFWRLTSYFKHNIETGQLKRCRKWKMVRICSCLFKRLTKLCWILCQEHGVTGQWPSVVSITHSLRPNIEQEFPSQGPELKWWENEVARVITQGRQSSLRKEVGI